MPQTFSYSDILEAKTPSEVTRAAFWRARRRFSRRADWGMFVPGNGLAGADRRICTDSLPREIRRHLPADRPRLSLNWRTARQGADAWSTAAVCFLPLVPRDVLLELVGGFESTGLVRAERGEDAEVSLLGADGALQESLGRDRLGMVDTMDLFEPYLRLELGLGEAEPLDFYVTGPAGGMASAYLNRGDARGKMHDRLRDAAG